MAFRFHDAWRSPHSWLRGPAFRPGPKRFSWIMLGDVTSGTVSKWTREPQLAHTRKGIGGAIFNIGFTGRLGLPRPPIDYLASCTPAKMKRLFNCGRDPVLPLLIQI